MEVARERRVKERREGRERENSRLPFSPLLASPSSSLASLKTNFSLPPTFFTTVLSLEEEDDDDDEEDDAEVSLTTHECRRASAAVGLLEGSSCGMGERERENY